MSAFDKRVCQWLGTASIPDKSKTTILNRMRVGILNYRSLELEKLTTNTTGRHVDKSVVDYSLLDHISSAIYRLESNESSTAAAEPLFPPNDVPPAATRGNGSAVTALRVEPDEEDGVPATSPSAAVVAPATDDTSSAPATADSPYATFKFGEEHDVPFTSSTNNEELDADDGDDIDAGEVDDTEAEEIRRRQLKRQSRNAVSAEPINLAEAKQFKLPKFPKSLEITQRLIKFLESHHLFAHLEDDDIAALAESMILTTFKRGEYVATKGESNDRMYIVVSGSVAVKGGGAESDKVNVGGSFGDVGLMYDVQHAETYESAVEGTQVCSVDRSTYQALCAKSSQEKRERYSAFLSRVGSLKLMTPTERLQIADALKTSKFKKGEKLITFGDEGRWFFLIIEGTVNVVGRNEKQEEVQVCSFGEGQSIGELELLHKHRAVADCVADSDVKVAKMTSRHFLKVIGSAKEFLERQAEQDEVYSYYRSSKRVSS